MFSQRLRPCPPLHVLTQESEAEYGLDQSRDVRRGLLALSDESSSLSGHTYNRKRLCGSEVGPGSYECGWDISSQKLKLELVGAGERALQSSGSLHAESSFCSRGSQGLVQTLWPHLSARPGWAWQSNTKYSQVAWWCGYAGGVIPFILLFLC